MKSSTFFRIFKNGMLNYTRNFWLSFAASAVMVITLFMMSSLLIISSLANFSLTSIQDKVDISVYFNLNTSDTVIQQIKKQVEMLPEVKSVDFIPSVSARENFLNLHKDDPLLVESVQQFSDEENPFPASFAIRVNNLSDYQKIITIFQDEKFVPFVKKITDKRDIVEQLQRIIYGIKEFGLAATGVFSIITILVMFNTIRLTIYNRRDEIEVMRLVGASNWYIRGPFVIEGLFYGIIGAFAATIILYPAILGIVPKALNFLELNSSQFQPFGPHYTFLFAFQLLFGIVLATISSLIVIRKYLNT